MTCESPPSRFLIYGLTDPDNNVIRYIGKSCSGLQRPKAHGRPSSLKGPDHCARWIRRLQADGKRFGIVVLEEAASADLNWLEQFWVAQGRSLGWPLTNMTEGGEGLVGFRQSAETRRKIGHGNLGQKRSPETRALIAATRRGSKLTAETKAKISAAHRQRLAGMPQERARLATLRLGMTNSQEAREKLRLANLGLKHSAERRAVNARAQTGRKQSDETKRKRSESLKATFAAKRAALFEEL